MHADSAVHAAGDLVEHVFVDDAILIGKQYIFVDYTPEGGFMMNSTILVSVNSNSKDMMGHAMLFPVDWSTSSCIGPVDLMQFLPQPAWSLTVLMTLALGFIPLGTLAKHACQMPACVRSDTACTAIAVAMVEPLTLCLARSALDHWPPHREDLQGPADLHACIPRCTDAHMHRLCHPCVGLTGRTATGIM